MVARKLAEKDVAAYGFNGTNSLVTLAALTGGAAADTATTMLLQFKLKNVNNQTIASFQGTNTKVKFAIYNRRIVVVNNAVATLVTGNLDLEPGYFYKAVYTFDGTNHKLYFWNIATATSATAADTGVINYLRLGNMSTPTDAYYSGILSHVAYYTRVLTTQEITDYLNNAQALFTGAVLNYDLKEGVGTTVIDSSGNGNNATSANVGFTNAMFGDAPGSFYGRTAIGANMLRNGDISHTNGNPGKAGTSLRWMNGMGGGSFGDYSYGYYFTRGATGSALFDTTVQYGGMNTFRLSTEGTGGSVTITTPNQGNELGALIPCKPGHTYVITAMVKTQNVAANSIYMKLNERGNITAQAIKSARSDYMPAGTNDWTELTFTDTTWPQIHYLMLEIHLDSNGNDAIAWFANIRIYEDGLPMRFSKSPVLTGKHFGFNTAWDLASINPSNAQITAVFDDMLELGMDTVRGSFTWNYIKSTSGGGYNFAVYDRFVNIAVAKGFTVLPILSGPGWTNGTTQAWHDYYQTVSAHFAPLGVYHFEYYNEANITTQYTTDCSPQKYWNGLEKMSEGIRDGNPNAKVVFSGLTRNSTEERNSSLAWSPNTFLQALYDLGAKGYFDIMNYHPYDWNDNAFFKIFDVLQANGDGNMPVWITEYGLATAGGGEPRAGSENEQVEAMKLAVKKVRNWGQLERCIFYNYRDEPNSPTSVEGHFGWKYTDSSNKPVWNVVKDAILNGTQ